MKNNALRVGCGWRLYPEPLMPCRPSIIQTDPSRYRHWRIERDGDIAYLIMDVDQAGGLR